MSIEQGGITGAITLRYEDAFPSTGFADVVVIAAEATDAEVWDLANRIKASDYVTSRMTNTPTLSGDPTVTRTASISEP
jgi:hypothetical protein